MEILIENKKARLEFFILESFEAGLKLTGSEVKMLRTKRGSLVGAHVRVLNGEAILLNAQIMAYPFARQEDYDPKQTRVTAQTRNLKIQHTGKGLAMFLLRLVLA